MIGLCAQGKEDFQIREVATPVLEPGFAIVKVDYCGICGSDVTAYLGTNPTMKYPIEGVGHEGVGVIVAIGDNEKGLQVGDRVAMEPYVPCNECHMCKEGRFNNCANLRVCGVHKDGMMVEEIAHPIQLLYPLPEELSNLHGALVEPLTIGLHGVSRARVKAGEYCVIFGAGTIGLMAAFGCLEAGATPIVIDIIQSRLERAKDFGIPHVFNSKDGDVVEHLQAVTGGKLPEAMVDCTGSPFVLQEMHNYVCHGGRIALVGWPHNPVAINTVRCMQKELDICPSRNSNAQFPKAIEMVTNHKLPVEKIITKVIVLDQVEATILDMIANPEDYVKVIVKI